MAGGAQREESVWCEAHVCKRRVGGQRRVPLQARAVPRVPHAHLAFDVGGEEERRGDACQAERRAVACEREKQPAAVRCPEQRACVLASREQPRAAQLGASHRATVACHTQHAARRSAA